MILMACVDGRNGMAFNCRRQSRDRAVRADLLAEAGEARLWVSGATARQFPAEEQSRLCVDESFLEKAGPGEPCFCGGPLCGALCRACGAGGAVPLGPGLSGGPLLGPVPGGLDSGPAGGVPRLLPRDHYKGSLYPMNRTRISLTAALLSLCLLLSGCMMPPAEGTVTSFSGGYPRLVRGALRGRRWQPAGFSGGGHDLCVL